MKKLVFLFLLLACPHSLLLARSEIDAISVNDEVNMEVELQIIEVKLRSYVEELDMLAYQISTAPEKWLIRMEGKLSQMRTKYTFYCQAQQMYIALDDSLMSLVARYQEMEQMVSDSILNQRQRFQQVENFNQAERFIVSQDTTYQRMLQQSLLLSQVEQTAPRLEELKGREQLIFSEIEKQFLTAKTAAAATLSLRVRQSKLEGKYIELKNTSGKIQSAAYQPFIQRIKDTLMGVAAVGIILIFINLVITKIQGYKKMRESTKKMQEMMRKAKDDYPKI